MLMSDKEFLEKSKMHVMKILSLVQELGKPSLNFGLVFSVNQEYIVQAIRIGRVLQGAINPQNLSFDINKARDIINQDSSLYCAGIINEPFTQSSANANAIIQKITDALKNHLSVILSSDQLNQYRNVIVKAFSNLTFKEGEASIFWSSREAHKTTYQYNVLFALNDQKTGGVMFGLALASTIIVNIQTERILCDQVKDIHEYSVLVQGIKVVDALPR
ncbi:MAG: hypothetical protein F6K54_02690 [Okeania sp. SIO3B5]|uniref:hypothetical protein n=1 Tax=Okeania sp. SIO3B5 TaxID=2607811 RepID=UPI00140120B9|nr:hypothetical protein [Okeania sp. SIO3B5]NEO52084.1 hypothetical protein [Okeania sp. SIO3B5]